MHPPYRPKPGTVFAEYRLQLPATRPIRLTFFNAIRDSAPNEPKSDGVTFRVWANGEQLFERHTDAKVWTPGEADLSRFAGREILLRLESHPGPKHNTVCDSSFWGDPVVVAGNPPKLLTADERRASSPPAPWPRPRRARPAARISSSSNCRRTAAPPWPWGPMAWPTACWPSLVEGHVLALDGLRVAILDQPLGDWPSGVVRSRVSRRA